MSGLQLWLLFTFGFCPDCTHFSEGIVVRWHILAALWIFTSWSFNTNLPVFQLSCVEWQSGWLSFFITLFYIAIWLLSSGLVSWVTIWLLVISIIFVYIAIWLLYVRTCVTSPNLILFIVKTNHTCLYTSVALCFWLMLTQCLNIPQ